MTSCQGKNCRICNRRHNSVLHDFNFSLNYQNSKTNQTAHNNQNSNQNCNVARDDNNPNENFDHNSGKIPTAKAGNSGTSSSAGEVSSPRPADARASGPCMLTRAPNTKFELSNRELSSRRAANTKFELSNRELSSRHAEHILLATTMVDVFDVNNRPVRCRALLDSGSQSNFCTKELFERLNIPSKKLNSSILGINNVRCNMYEKFNSKLKSINESFQSNVEFLVIDKITTKLPQISFEPDIIKIWY